MNRKKIRIEVDVTATREELWAAFQAEVCRMRCREAHEEDFLRVMHRLDPLVRREHLADADRMWRSIWALPELRHQLIYQQTRRRGTIHYYNVLSVLKFLLDEAEFFGSRVTLRQLADSLVADRREAERYYRGRSAYVIVGGEQIVEVGRSLMRKKR